jgi:hypothetical protein
MVTRLILCACFVAVGATAANSQEPSAGETLITPSINADTHLIDMDGVIVKTWHGGGQPATIAYMLEDRSIIRPSQDPGGAFIAGGFGGRLQRIDAQDTLVWEFYASTEEYQQHHDIEPMPGGNVLVIAWERKTNAEAIAAGRQSITGEMWPTLIAEIEPVGATGGNIVWEWHAWDHIIQDVDPAKPNHGVVADHPELIDINYGNVTPAGSWIHANSIDYDATYDQIVFSARAMSEVYVIDHSTTTEEAAGHTGGNSGMGGDILYRWGNPQAYDRGTLDDQYFFAPHGANLIDPGLPGEGNILVFNNGDRPGTANDYSTVDEIAPPRDPNGHYSIEPDSAFGPVSPTWTYGGPGGFYGGPTHCGAFRLPNGNTLIGVAPGGYLFEVTGPGTIVWEYDHPVGRIARAQRYPEQATGLPTPDLATVTPVVSLTSHPNPFAASTKLSCVIPAEAQVKMGIFSASGRRVTVLVDGLRSQGELHVTWDGRDDAGREVTPGVYFARVDVGVDAKASSALHRLVLRR